MLQLLLLLQVTDLLLERSQLSATYVRQTLSHFLQMLRLVLQLHLVEQLLLLGGQGARVQDPMAKRRWRRKAYGSSSGGSCGCLQLVSRECRAGIGRRGRHDQAGLLGLALQEGRPRLVHYQRGRLRLTADHGRHVLRLLRLHLNRRL